MEEIGGYPVIIGILKRLNLCSLIETVVLATSDDTSDDILEETAREYDFPVVRGNLDDVLSRFMKAAEAYPADYYLRVTGDCPLIDPDCIRDLIHFFQEGTFDYASNALEPTLPDGLDCEIFTEGTLKKVLNDADHSQDREHVTLYIYSNPDEFSVGSLKYHKDYSGYRVTLDTPEDLNLIRELVGRIEKPYIDIRLEDIADLFESDPELFKINSMYQRNEGLKSDL